MSIRSIVSTVDIQDKTNWSRLIRHWYTRWECDIKKIPIAMDVLFYLRWVATHIMHMLPVSWVCIIVSSIFLLKGCCIVWIWIIFKRDFHIISFPWWRFTQDSICFHDFLKFSRIMFRTTRFAGVWMILVKFI